MVLSIAAEPIPLSVDAHGTVHVVGAARPSKRCSGSSRRARPHEIVEAFPDLELADVYAIITYYLRHREDVDAYLHEQEAQAAAIRSKIEAHQGDRRDMRERLLAAGRSASTSRGGSTRRRPQLRRRDRRGAAASRTAPGHGVHPRRRSGHRADSRVTLAGRASSVARSASPGSGSVRVSPPTAPGRRQGPEAASSAAAAIW